MIDKTSIAVLMVLVTAVSSCSQKTVSVARREQEFLLERSLRYFRLTELREEAFDGEDLEQHVHALLRSTVSPSTNFLDLEAIDPDELLVMLLCGRCTGKGAQGHYVWEPIGDGNAPYFVPAERFLSDLDKDGWLEYRIPGTQNRTFCLCEHGKLVAYVRREGK